MRRTPTATGDVLEAVVQVRRQGALATTTPGWWRAGAKSRQGAHATKRLALREDADGLIIEDADRRGALQERAIRSRRLADAHTERPPRASPRGRAGSPTATGGAPSSSLLGSRAPPRIPPLSWLSLSRRPVDPLSHTAGRWRVGPRPEMRGLAQLVLS